VNLKVQHELFADCVADSAVLMAMHWKELYGARGFRMDFGGISDSETVGGFKYFTLRTEEGQLVGHLGMMVFKPPYYGLVIAMDIFYYVLPEHRGSMAICKLLKFGGETLKAMGVQQVNMSHPVDNDLGIILKRAGYTKTSDMYKFGD